MRNVQRATRAVLLAAVALSLAACAPRQPVYVSPALDTQAIRAIGVAPLVEERAFPETQVPLATYVAQAAERALSQHGYEAHAYAAPPVVRLEEPLLDAEAAALPDLPDRYGLWIAVELLETDSSYPGLDTRVRLAGILVDDETDEVLRRDLAFCADVRSRVSGRGKPALNAAAPDA
jgi:hypothetical protein